MKRIFNKYTLLLILAFIANKGFTQIDPEFTHYMFNLQQHNPSYVGTVHGASITGILRSQWVGMEGAPESQILSYSMPIVDKKMGLGLNFVNDKIGPSSYKSFELLYSYNIQMSENGNLALGFNAGGSFLDIDFNKGNFENSNDNARNNISNEFYLKAGAGFMYYTPKWFIGLSVPNFFKRDFYDEEIRNVVADKIQYNLLAGYNIDLHENLLFRPTMLANIVNGNPITAHVNANFLYQEKLSFGLGYRYKEALSAMAGFEVFPNLKVGYAYDFGINDFNEYHNGSHEILLKFNLEGSSSAKNSLTFF
jgi:type IX secretion system PorP/SprF family membrane protein